MTPYTKNEIAVGCFMVVGIVALAYLSLSLGQVELTTDRPYVITARFSDAGDLKKGASVKLAGVRIGEVANIRLNNYVAEVLLAIQPLVALPRDTIASVETSGLLGSAYVSLSPGASDKNLKGGDRITRTEPAKNLMDLISKYAFGTGFPEEPRSGSPPPRHEPPDVPQAQKAFPDLLE